jgi:hypothetical protein
LCYLDINGGKHTTSISIGVNESLTDSSIDHLRTCGPTSSCDNLTNGVTDTSSCVSLRVFWNIHDNIEDMSRENFISLTHALVSKIVGNAG